MNIITEDHHQVAKLRYMQREHVKRINLVNYKKKCFLKQKNISQWSTYFNSLALMISEYVIQTSVIMTPPLGYSWWTSGEFPQAENEAMYRGISKKGWGKLCYASEWHWIYLGLSWWRLEITVQILSCRSQEFRVNLL